jgi:hypothetical protein
METVLTGEIDSKIEQVKKDDKLFPEIVILTVLMQSCQAIS